MGPQLTAVKAALRGCWYLGVNQLGLILFFFWWNVAEGAAPGGTPRSPDPGGGGTRGAQLEAGAGFRGNGRAARGRGLGALTGSDRCGPPCGGAIARWGADAGPPLSRGWVACTLDPWFFRKLSRVTMASQVTRGQPQPGTAPGRTIPQASIPQGPPLLCSLAGRKPCTAWGDCTRAE